MRGVRSSAEERQWLRASAFDRLSGSAAILDGDGIILDTNQAWRLFARLNDGHPEQTDVGADYLAVCDAAGSSGDDAAAAVCTALREILRGERVQFEIEYPCPSPTQDRWFVLQASALAAADGTGLLVVHTDITARRMVAERMARVDGVDARTGLADIDSASRFVDEQLLVCVQVGDSVGVIALLVRDASAVADRYGSNVAEGLVVQVAMRARRLMRQGDWMSRSASDGLIVVCPSLGVRDTEALALRLRSTMNVSPFQIGDLEIGGCVSVGVAISDPWSTSRSLVGAARAAAQADPAPMASATAGSPALQHSSLRLRRDASAAHLSAIVEASPDAIFSASTTGEVLSWNNGAETLFGRSAVDTIGQHLSRVLPNGRADDVRHVFESALDGRIIELFDTRGLRADGTDIHLSISVSPIRSPTGTIIGTSAIARDITERMTFVHRIEADRCRLAFAQSSAKLGSFEVDTVTGHTTRSDELWRLLGVTPVDGQTARFDLVHPDDRERIRLQVESVIAGGPPIAGEYRLMRPDGLMLWVYTQAARLEEPDAHIVAGTMLDVTDRHTADAALEHQATHDWLTDLLNQAGFDPLLAAQVSPSGRRHGVAIAMIDLDHFALINDQAGHAIGDQTLRAVAARMRAKLLPTDVLARAGGDEFIVMRPGVTNVEGAHALARDALAMLVEPVQIADRQVRVTASVGVTVSAADDSAESLMRDADDAMYQAKRDGRNCSVVLDSRSRSEAHRRQRIASELPSALGRNEFHLEYQPVVDLATDSVAGFEALIRWTHPTMGDIAPDEFISVAEYTGAINSIGSWVLETAVRQLAVWRADERVSDDLWMAVNVSAHQLSQPNFVDRVASTIVRADVPADAVHLEITESVLMGRIDDALRIVGELQTCGLRVSIDDFGTGYSSLAYLSRLPVDTIKIDRSFVSGTSASGNGASIIRAMMTLARTLDLDVVAEGIENSVQRSMLTELGCTFGQGFLWSPALGADAALEWMAQRPLGPDEVGDRRPDEDSAEAGSIGMGDIGDAILTIAHTTGRRRRAARDLQDMVRFEELEIGLHAQKLWIGRREVALTPKEFELLAFFATHHGETFSRSDLLSEVWQSTSTWQTPATVTEHVHRLRSKIEHDPAQPTYIRTVRHRGYCLGAPRYPACNKD